MADFLAQPLELLDETVAVGIRFPVEEVPGAEVSVRLMAAKYVIDDDQH